MNDHAASLTAASEHQAAEPPARRSTGSLTRRMIGVAAFWIAALLLTGGFALDRVLTRSIVDSFDNQLVFILNSMVASMGFAVGSIVLTLVAARAGTPAAIVAGAVLLAAAAPLYLVKDRRGSSAIEFREHSHSGTSESQAL